MGEIVTTTLKSGGEEINSNKNNIILVDIINTVNKIPVAELVLNSSAFDQAEVAISESDFFKPGNEIEISIKKGVETALFKGIVVKVNSKTTKASSSLTVTVKDYAVKITGIRKNLVYKDKKDSDIIDELIEGGELGKDDNNIETNVTHNEMVQFYSTDWDFIISRAEANGLWVIADNGVIKTMKPDMDSVSLHIYDVESTNEATKVYEFDLTANIQGQYGKVESTAWDIKEQKLFELSEATELNLKQDNLKPEDLATKIGNNTCTLIDPVAISPEETKTWADAKMIKSRMSMIRGYIRVAGSGKLKPGDMVELKGVGNKFNGNTLITGIRHQIKLNEWETYLQLGTPQEWFTRNNDVVEVQAAGLLPAINGLQIGKVSEFIDDPEYQLRVKVEVPAISNKKNENQIWARLASPDAGNRRGYVFRPEKGDEVVLGFLNNDPRQAIILGALHSLTKEIPEEFKITAENNKKGIITRGALKLFFDDEKKEVAISTPNGNSIKMNDKGIVLKSNNDITIDGDKIIIKGSKVEVK